MGISHPFLAQVWITSKISPSRAANYKQCAKATADLLEELGVAFVDLLLIHTPKLGEEKTVELWRCLVDAKARGQVRAIGVSNFNGPEIDALEKATGVAPEVNQIQYHPWSSKEWHATVAALKARGVVTTAYNSLGGSRFPGSHGDVLPKLAAAHGATVPQLLLRWALQKGCAVIPGSSTPAHIAENLAAPAFALSADEMRRIEDAPTPAGWWEGARGTTGPNKYADHEAVTAFHDAAKKDRRSRHKTEHR